MSNGATGTRGILLSNSTRWTRSVARRLEAAPPVRESDRDRLAELVAGMATLPAQPPRAEQGKR